MTDEDEAAALATFLHQKGIGCDGHEKYPVDEVHRADAYDILGSVHVERTAPALVTARDTYFFEAGVAEGKRLAGAPLDWRGHIEAARRLLVGSPPNVDSIDAAIGYAFNDLEASIDAALAPDPEP